MASSSLKTIPPSSVQHHHLKSPEPRHSWRNGKAGQPCSLSIAAHWPGSRSRRRAPGRKVSLAQPAVHALDARRARSARRKGSWRRTPITAPVEQSGTCGLPITHAPRASKECGQGARSSRAPSGPRGGLPRLLLPPPRVDGPQGLRGVDDAASGGDGNDEGATATRRWLRSPQGHSPAGPARGGDAGWPCGC